jgi:23S rRNA pseudouridine2605 synthase
MTPPPETNPTGERIAKRIARAGLCSRREAERWIALGRVSVDGTVLTTPAVVVTAESAILVDGKPLPAEVRTTLWRYHKPAGVLVTHQDPEGRPTIFERIHLDSPHIISVGRLDFQSEGLLLLTNNGELARYLTLPKTGWARRYRVRSFGTPSQMVIDACAEGVTVEGIRYDGIQVVVEREQGCNCWLNVTLKEGKNREIRRIFDHFGHPVSRIIRLAYGPFQLDTLPSGMVEEVPRKMLRASIPKAFLG